MSSHPKRVIGEEDLLRQVPDDILCHILSLLPSKEAAKTCVLSKRWRHLFLRVPKLIAIDRRNDLFTRNPEMNQEMILFINRWIMSSEEAPVDEFRLSSTYFPEPSVFYLWLTTLLLRRIKVLELKGEGFAGRPTAHLFPLVEFFRSETLVTLSIIGNAFVLHIPDSVCYSSLKTLHLEELHAVDSSGHFRFIDAGFPRLEELCLKCVHFRSAATKEYVKLFEDESILTISLVTLKKLVVYYDTHMIDRVDIDTQHLEHFQFTVETEVDMKVNFSQCESLVYADIYQFNPGESYFKLLSEINNVKTLRLSDHSPEDYIGVAVPFPQFIHLTHLKLRETAHQSVWNLLHHAPNLQVLDFIMSFKYEDYLPPEVVPQCLSQSLKEIRIEGYKWYEDDIDDEDIEDDDEVGEHAKIVEYFLQHGSVLERLSLGHSKIRTAEWRQSMKSYHVQDAAVLQVAAETSDLHKDVSPSAVDV